MVLDSLVEGVGVSATSACTSVESIIASNAAGANLSPVIRLASANISGFCDSLSVLAQGDHLVSLFWHYSLLKCHLCFWFGTIRLLISPGHCERYSPWNWCRKFHRSFPPSPGEFVVGRRPVGWNWSWQRRQSYTCRCDCGNSGLLDNCLFVWGRFPHFR